MKEFSIFFALFSSFYIIVSQSIYSYSKEFIFQKLNNLTETEENLNNIINNISKLFDEAYAFNELSKNPPQPEFNKNYYKKINIQEKLKAINTKNINFYKFYQEVRKVTDSLEDYHITLNLDISSKLNLKEIFIFGPLNLTVQEFENKPRIFGKFLVSEEEFNFILPYFKNNETMYKIIKKNINIPIESINGIDPFEYIINFGGDYKKLKNPQATFSAKYKFFAQLGIINLLEYPLSIEDFSNFTVIYDNKDNFTTEYIFLSNIPLDNENNKNKLLINEPKLLLKNIFNKNNTDINKIKFNLNDNKIKWEYDYLGLFKCAVDEDNKVNLYFISSFISFFSIKEYIETIQNCSKLFDNNIYPIILVNNFNSGGIIYISQYLLELLCPRIAINIYGAIRKTEIIKDTTDFKEFLKSLNDNEKCDSLDYQKLIKNENKINYNDDISDILLGPLIFQGKEFRKKINSIKKNLKNKRKPTDILIYTDGYTYSAGALLIKYIQYYGGGITAGYFPYPKLENNIFDSGLSATNLFTSNNLDKLDIKEYKTLKNNYNITLEFPGIQTFFNPNDLSHPLEYEITPVDEIVNIYNPEIEYKAFINESLKIFEKYKTKCNPKNMKLVLVTDECDKIFENNYTHGGYECGENGFWTKNCVASYCDIGYIFDFNTKRCIIDICSNNSNNNKNSDFNIFFIIFLFSILIIIIIIILIFFIKIKSNKNKDYNEINSIEKQNLVESDNSN